MSKTALSLVLIALLQCIPAGARVKRRSHPQIVMEATAFARAHHPTAAGTAARPGIVASDPARLPLGTRIRITGADAYDGVYLVTDTGAAVKGRHIDLYIPSRAEARQFGTKLVGVEILEMGTGRPDARNKDVLLARNSPQLQ